MQEKQRETLQKWVLRSSWKSRRLEALILKKGLFPGLSEGQKNVGRVSKNTTEKAVLYNCSVNKSNYLEYTPSFVIGFSSYTDTVTSNCFVCARYSSALPHYSFPFPVCPVSPCLIPWGRDCSAVRVCTQDKQLFSLCSTWNLWEIHSTYMVSPILQGIVSCSICPCCSGNSSLKTQIINVMVMFKNKYLRLCLVMSILN